MARVRLVWACLAFTVAVVVAVAAGRARLRPDAAALLAEARSEYGAGRYDAAAEVLASLARLHGPNPADRVLRGQVALARGRDEEALDELATVPEGGPGAAFARFLSGTIEEGRGRLRAAEGHYRAALAGESTEILARRRLAYILLLQHRLDEFDEQYRSLSDSNQLDDRALAIWSRVHSGIWDASSDMDALRKAVASDAEDRRSRLALAEALLRANRPDESESELSPLADSDPDARALRVSIALARGDRSKAEALLAGGPTDHPGLARLRGTQALARHEAPAAARHFRIVLAAMAYDRAALFGLGTALRMQGESAEAESLLEAARRHDRLGTLVERVVRQEGLDGPRMRFRLGEACEAAGRLDEALAWYRSAIARDPLDEESQRALYRLNSRQVEGARPPAHGRAVEGLSPG
jgi:tetratricopeptide (TPR) repeat protein